MKKGIDYPGITTVFLCHDGNGNYLLSKRSIQCRDEHGTWDPGAGALEHGLPVLENLKKEIEEEYCTEVLELEHLGYRDVHREHKGEKTHWIALDFKVLINRDKVKIGEPHKIEAIGWFKKEEFPEPLHSQFPHFLEKYKDKM